MKKKILQLIILVFSFSLLLAVKPMVAKAEDVPVTTNKSAIDVNSQQLLDGTGYFKKTNDSAEYTFYYTNYNGTDVDYTTNESLYVRTINKSVIPTNWYNESTGLDLESFESISIIQGKWALPKEYVTDFKGNIIPNSTGYLQESVYSDCRRYVYYITYKNDDGVQRPVYTKHYECDVELEKIPDYLLSSDKKNEKMGVLYGSIYDTQLTKFKAVKVSYMYPELHYNTVFTENMYGENGRWWYPIIYFNLDDVDYDVLLSVKFSYIVTKYKKGLFGVGYTEDEDSRKEYVDEVYFDEVLIYSDHVMSIWDALRIEADTNWGNYYNTMQWYYDTYHKEYKLLESGSWNKENVAIESSDGVVHLEDIEFKNRIVGHLTDKKVNINLLNNVKKEWSILKNSVSFISISYMFDGVLYKSDDNVTIGGVDVAPGHVSVEDAWADLLENLMKNIGSMAGTVVNTTGQGLLTFLKEFFSSLSPAVWTIIIIVGIVFLITITRSLWMPLLTKKTLKDDRLVEQSFKMQNRNAYNRSENKRRRWTNENKKYYDKRYKKRRKDVLTDRDFITERVDKKICTRTIFTR